MYPSVQARFRAFNEPFEGSIPYMYLDVKGLVTVGVGNLIDPVELAVALAFRFKGTGLPALPVQIAAEWRKLKDDPVLARKGHLACAALTDLELRDDTIAALISQRLMTDDRLLKRQTAFQGFETWPADAQLALLSMAWAMGPDGFERFHGFRDACQRRDFKTAASTSKLDEVGNPGVIPRNRANFLLFSNAAVVAASRSALDPATLFFPRDLSQAGMV